MSVYNIYFISLRTLLCSVANKSSSPIKKKRLNFLICPLCSLRRCRFTQEEVAKKIRPAMLRTCKRGERQEQDEEERKPPQRTQRWSSPPNCPFLQIQIFFLRNSESPNFSWNTRTDRCRRVVHE